MGKQRDFSAAPSQETKSIGASINLTIIISAPALYFCFVFLVIFLLSHVVTWECDGKKNSYLPFENNRNTEGCLSIASANSRNKVIFGIKNAKQHHVTVVIVRKLHCIEYCLIAICQQC
jgi:hypothetical protein